MINYQPKWQNEMLRKLLLLCLSFECFTVSSWMSTLDITDYMDRATGISVVNCVY